MQTNRMATLGQPCKEHIGFVCVTRETKADYFKAGEPLAVQRCAGNYQAWLHCEFRCDFQKQGAGGRVPGDISGGQRWKWSRKEEEKRGGEGKDLFRQGII